MALILLLSHINCQINFNLRQKQKAQSSFQSNVSPLQFFSESEIVSMSGSDKGVPPTRPRVDDINNKVVNADIKGNLPQQVLIRTHSHSSSSDCTGSMLTKYIAITAAHCLKDRLANRDVLVYPHERNCGGFQAGIPACKVVERTTGSTCSYNGHDIALVRLSRPMPGMRNLRLNFDSPRVGDRTVMAGTGVNYNRTCESLISYQTVVDCSQTSCRGAQWYCTRATFKRVGGACTGDSGGPSWTFRSGLTGLTAGATVSASDEQCSNGFSLFTNLNYYKSWIESNMRGSLATCVADLLDVRINFG